MPVLVGRLKNAWDAFKNGIQVNQWEYGYTSSSGYRPDRPRLTRGNAKSIKSMIYNRIAVDCSQIDIKHVRLDEEDRYSETIKDSLNYALTKQANLDQTGRDLIRDAVLSMLDEGSIAIVPTIIDGNPNKTDGYKIYELRVGRIVEWMPYQIRVEVYNEKTGKKEQITLSKRFVAIVENPFYETMNTPNSTMQRLIRVLSQVDRTNDLASANKIDIIFQLPYALKSDAQKVQAEHRLQKLEAQMTKGQYGIGYIDSTEKIIQLNRSIENNLWAQAEKLTEDLYNQLGLSKAIFDGTADEAAQLNYNNKTIEPILSALVEAMECKWISKTALAQKQAIRFFRNPFKLVPVEQLAKIADTFTRNEIMTSNEVRAIIGLRPSKDPKADELVNSNINQVKDGTKRQAGGYGPDENSKSINISENQEEST